MPTCPRCHRPLDDTDGESYICCAAAELSWRCDGCGKASEGFAFPYGLCPACGENRLHLVEGRDAGDEASLAAIRTAFEIELGGRSFYRRASQEAREPAMRELFGRFEAMEGEHMATLTRRYHVDPPPEAEGFQIDKAALYAGVEHRPDDPVNLFRVAIGFEERAVRFFAEAGARAPAGSPERALHEELGAEEREHVALLQTELARYQAAKPGLL